MYYYAWIDPTTCICYEVVESETQVTDDPYSIEIDSYDTSYIIRKKYIDGKWVDTDPIETNSMQVRLIGVGEQWLDDKIVEMENDIANHTHSGYASSDDLALLEDVVDTKADATHTHSEYASASHGHADYATQTSLNTLSEEVENKADVSHSHNEYALSTHEHDEYAEVNHNHDTSYSPLSHSHSNYVTTTDFDTLETEVDGKADEGHTHTEYAASSHTHDEYAETNHIHSDYSVTTHNHDDDYASISHTHTASEIGAAASGHNHDSDYADVNHNHDSEYATVGHDHDEDYAALSHTHIDYATATALSELSATVSGKANASHSHDNTYYTETEIDAKLADKADSSHTHTDVYDAIGAAASALTSANAYTDTEIEALGETVATKANTSDLTSHTGNTTVHITSTERTNWNAAKTHANSAHAPANAEPNQNAFSNVVVNGTTISADSKTDTLTFVAGNNVTITPDATGDSITISSANTVYTHPTTAGNKHIPAGGSSGQILRWASDGTAVWGSDNNTTYSNATQTASGLMSDTDKVKLDGIATGANNYVLPSAGSSLGGVKSGGDVTISSGVITVNDDSHNHVISNVDGLQSALDSKAASGHNHDGVYYTETEIDTLLEGKANSSHTHTISNITNLQSTLDGKANASHGTHVSYSTTAPVMDGTASVGTASTVARSDHKHPTDTSRAAQTSLDSHTSNKSNPHGVTLAQLGVTATVAELNKMDGVTATTAELNILDGITATTTEINYVDGVTSNIQTQLNAKASSSHTHGTATTSAAGLMSASDKSKLDGIASGANAYTLPTASSTLGGVKTTSTVTSNSGYTACPIIGGVPYYKDTNTTYNLGSFGVTATAAELNALDGITATVTELNYVDGVTSNIQTQLNGKAASSHTHNYAGSSSAGGAATSANKLATARTISLTGDVTGSTSFDGSGNVSITATVADDSHNHIISNVDGLQSALDGKSATSHNHNSAYISKDLQMTADNGDISISWSGKDVVAQFKALASGMYTAYSPAGCTNNPNSNESFRFMIHKTGSANYGWIMAYGAQGSVYTGYIDNGNWKGWKALFEAAPQPLWTGASYMTDVHTITPSKTLSQCRNGWLLLWSDYDPGSGANNTDFYASVINKRAYTGQVWNGGEWYCDVPSYSAGTATDSEQRVIKLLKIYDSKIVGTPNNSAAPRNDVVLRAVYEW